MTAKEIHALKVERDEFVREAWNFPGGVDPKMGVWLEQMDARIAKAETAVGGKVFKIPSGNIGWLEAEIEKINKVAAKLDVAPITLDCSEREVIETFRYNEALGETEPAFYEFCYAIIAGETPRVAGFEFVATLEHEDAGTIIRRVPTFDGDFDLTPYRDAKAENCDHCGFVRNRKDTYLVRNFDTGEIKQVGRQCLKDFTGAHNPEKFARLAERMRDLFEALDGDLDGDGEERGGRGERHFSLRETLAVTIRGIHEFGWMSKGAAQMFERSTADRVETFMFERGKPDEDTKRLTPHEDDYAKADEVIEWVRSEQVEQEAASNDYLWNLSVSAATDYITARKFGIICSAPASFDRAREREIKQARRREQQAASEFVGTEGKREVFTLTLLRIIEIEDRYSYNGGSKPLYIFEDPDGNSVKWFASNTAGTYEDAGVSHPVFIPISEGESYQVKATVKRHEDSDQYGKSTIITRAKIEAKVAEAVA